MKPKKPRSIYIKEHLADFCKKSEGYEFAGANDLKYYPKHGVIGWIGKNEMGVNEIIKIRDFCNELLDYAAADAVEKAKAICQTAKTSNND